MPEWLTLTNETARPIAKYCEGHAGRPRRLTEFDLPGHRAPPTPGTSGEGGHPHRYNSHSHHDGGQPSKRFEHPGDDELPDHIPACAKYIMIPMTGTATMPLITAVQTSAFIGFIGVKLSTAPITVASMIVPLKAFAFMGFSRQPGGPA
jgi:hypothetical protein